MNIKVIYLKTQIEYFEAVEKGSKTFELRKNDRDFRVKDICILEKYDGKKCLDEQIAIEISYIFHGGKYGLDKDHCILGFTKKQLL
jgi:hypothetical protein